MFRTTSHGNLAYEVITQSSPTDWVILNGNLASSRWWYPTVEKTKTAWSGKELKGRLIFLELPGCGQSGPVPNDISVKLLAEEYVSILSDLKLSSDARIMGHSTGGLLASYLMADSRLSFCKALLLDPVAAKGISFDDSVLEKYEEMKTSKDLTGAIIAFTILNCDTSSEFFKNVILEDTFGNVNKTGSKMIKALRDLDSTSILKSVKTPTTILFGDQDYLLPRADAEALTTIMSQAKFQLIKGAGHCLNIENPNQMAELIIEHLWS